MVLETEVITMQLQSESWVNANENLCWCDSSIGLHGLIFFYEILKKHH